MTRPRVRAAVATLTVLVVATVGAACSRSGGNTAADTTSVSTTPSASASGTFGSLGRVCGPGDASGATARGVTDKTIKVGTMSDEGSSIVPGLNHEFFDASTAFVRWCNAAGGIEGRKLVLEKHDADLFGAAQQMISACQSDFMEVGGGTVIDEPGVAPRVHCGLAEIPVIEISTPAISAPLQVAPGVSSPSIQLVGAYRLLAKRYPSAVKHFGIGAPAVPAFVTQAQQYVAAAKTAGYKNVDFQEAPAEVDDWRPYIERSRKAGVEVLQPTATGDLMVPYVQAMNSVGWAPKAEILDYYNYLPQVIDAAKSTHLPPTWVGIDIWPLQLASQNPPTQLAVDLMKSALPKASVDSSDIESLGAWLLWAKGAQACGSHLTGSCVIDYAQHMTSWTAGGLYAPVNLQKKLPSDCVTMLRATPDGWVVDRGITQPNYRGIYNCSASNLVHIKVNG